MFHHSTLVMCGLVLLPGVKHGVGVHGRRAQMWLSWTLRGHKEAPFLALSWGTICRGRFKYQILFTVL